VPDHRGPSLDEITRGGAPIDQACRLHTIDFREVVPIGNEGRQSLQQETCR
jgi:hypothetical protein